ncbi:BamA/TamA family outer membrane protein [Fulvivirgaceae bacterium BMA10]|uniref:BamA/TamA family outer membrane protein n=1 Tax=Splendidivirga corallicola TaxID=3051826 RepID=A0ABT8KTD1_9BACT|nr:BamA/TamA family outer membrane protein [Fulvivirgaceae bacterium BMA10]
MKRFFVKLIMIICSYQSYGQSDMQINFVGNQDDLSILDKAKLLNKKIDSVQIQFFLKRALSDLHKRGYLQARFNILDLKDDIVDVHVEAGKVYKLARLDRGNLNEEIINKVGYKEKFYSDRPFNHHQVALLMQKVLDISENQGYPFASIQLDSISLVQNILRASLNYDPGPFITFDSLEVAGDAKLKEGFLTSYLRIIPGEPFDMRKIENVDAKLNRLPYLDKNKTGHLTFQNTQSTLHLEIDHKRVNQIDGIVGFLPNETDDGKLLLTGEFNLALYNLFSSGKGLQFNWQKLKKFSQFLRANYYHPNLFRSPVNLDFTFELLKEDTTFINRSLGFELSYEGGVYSRFKFFSKIRNTSLLSAATLRNVNELPDFLDSEVNAYGIGYEWNNLDDPFNPLRGFRGLIEADVGNKKIKRNANINSSLYDGVELTSIQLVSSFALENYARLSQRLVLRSKISGGKIFNDRLFLNDLFRIGGLKSLRGFNENFFFASDYLIANVELRLLLDRASYLLIFYDQAHLRKRLDNIIDKDNPYGLGVGLNFSTNAGIFSFIYALGNSRQQAFGFDSSKIHFGYISRL